MYNVLQLCYTCVCWAHFWGLSICHGFLTLAPFPVLLIAGLEIRVEQLKWHVFVPLGHDYVFFLILDFFAILRFWMLPEIRKYALKNPLKKHSCVFCFLSGCSWQRALQFWLEDGHPPSSLWNFWDRSLCLLCPLAQVNLWTYLDTQHVGTILALKTSGVASIFSEISCDLLWYWYWWVFQVSHCRHPKSAHLGNQVMQHSRVEGLMLGSVLAALGDGLVIPKMQAGGLGDGNPWIQIGFPILHTKKKVPSPPTKHRGGYCKKMPHFGKGKGVFKCHQVPVVGFVVSLAPTRCRRSLHSLSPNMSCRAWSPVGLQWKPPSSWQPLGCLLAWPHLRVVQAPSKGALRWGWGFGKINREGSLLHKILEMAFGNLESGVRFGSISSILVTVTNLQEYHGKNSSKACWCLSYS